jgi:hypothetical protein
LAKALARGSGQGKAEGEEVELVGLLAKALVEELEQGRAVA